MKKWLIKKLGGVPIKQHEAQTAANSSLAMEIRELREEIESYKRRLEGHEAATAELNKREVALSELKRKLDKNDLAKDNQYLKEQNEYLKSFINSHLSAAKVNICESGRHW